MCLAAMMDLMLEQVEVKPVHPLACFPVDLVLSSSLGFTEGVVRGGCGLRTTPPLPPGRDGRDRPMFRVAVALCLLLSLSSACAADDGERYRTLVVAAKDGKGPVDWHELRLAYAGTPDFDVFGARTAAARKAMFAAYQAGDFSGALKQAAQILDVDFVDIDAHLIGELASRRLGDTAVADAHHDAVIGLVRSIRTGDGRTPATAFTVISVGEEYGMLHALGSGPPSRR
jgi:hypothetical protein